MRKHLGGLLDWLSAEYIGAQLVARDRAASGGFDGDTVLGRDRALPANPLGDEAGVELQRAGEVSLAAKSGDGSLDRGREFLGHGDTVAKLSRNCNSIAHRIPDPP